jgi:hypothetical protein
MCPQSSDLGARTVLSLWAYSHYDDPEQFKQLTALYDNTPDSLLWITQVKIYSDGIIGNGTAALLEPIKASGRPCTAQFNELTGKLFIPVVQVEQNVLSTDLIRDNAHNLYRFTLASQHDLTLME